MQLKRKILDIEKTSCHVTIIYNCHAIKCWWNIFYGICNIKKNKKNSHKQPVIFENTYQSKRNPRDIGGKSVFVDANILYLYVLIYKIRNTVCLKIKVSQASW